jgi:hypothetical protein
MYAPNGQTIEENDSKQCSSVEPDADLSDRFLNTFYGNTSGWACFGYKPIEAAGGKQEKVIQQWFRWPDEVDRAVTWIEDMAPHHALYWSPLLRKTRSRVKGNAVGRRWLWLDLDGPPGNQDLLTSLGTIEIRSGRPGHTHHYVALKRVLADREWHRFARALRDAVGGVVDPKIADNDFLRLPGSLNFRTTPPTVVSTS